MIKKTSALILFAHGARDPRWAAPFERLLQLVQQSVADEVGVHLAFLELMHPSLPEVVMQLAEYGCLRISVVPVFLGQGGHVRRDLPELISRLEHDYPDVAFSLATAIGEDELVLQSIAQACIRSS